METISSLIDVINNALFIDYTYAEELQLQEALQASLNLSNNPNHISSPSKICCEICFEDIEKNEMFQIEGCPHSFCTICVSKHVQSKLQENHVFVSCPGENCINIIEPISLKAIVPPDVISRWEDALSESTILTSEKYYCPYKDCLEMLVNDNDEGNVITQTECPWCRRLFCAQCNVPWHQGIDCRRFKHSKQEKKEKEQLRLLAKENKWKKCAKCRVFVERNEGCIHMTCRCKYEFCYICGSEWNESHWTTCQR